MALKIVKPANKATVKSDGLHLIYKIEGSQHEVDIFDLSRALELLGQVVQEGTRLAHPDISLSLKVAPFEPGSFIADIALQVQHNPQMGLFAAMLTQPEMVAKAKEVLEYIGLVKRPGNLGPACLSCYGNYATGSRKVSKGKATFSNIRPRTGL
jgi:hypothetical protein